MPWGKGSIQCGEAVIRAIWSRPCAGSIARRRLEVETHRNRPCDFGGAGIIALADPEAGAVDRRGALRARLVAGDIEREIQRYRLAPAAQRQRAIGAIPVAAKRLELAGPVRRLGELAGIEEIAAGERTVAPALAGIARAEIDADIDLRGVERLGREQDVRRPTREAAIDRLAIPARGKTERAALGHDPVARLGIRLVIQCLLLR